MTVHTYRLAEDFLDAKPLRNREREGPRRAMRLADHPVERRGAAKKALEGARRARRLVCREAEDRRRRVRSRPRAAGAARSSQWSASKALGKSRVCHELVHRARRGHSA